MALVAELRQWKERARASEDDCRRLVEALAVAEATVATTVAEVQVRADHLVERARCEAEHLTLRAREEADRVREEIERRAHGPRRRRLAGRGALVDLDLAIPRTDPVFAQFMSDDIEDEPSREWVLGQT